MKKTLRFLGCALLALAFLLALLLSIGPTLIEGVARYQYAKLVPQGDLNIDDIEINYFSGSVQLKGLSAHKSQQQVLTLGRFDINIAMLDLLDGYVVVEDVTLADFSIALDQSDQRIIAGGYEHVIEEAPVGKGRAETTPMKHNTAGNVRGGDPEAELTSEPIFKGVRLKRLALDNIKVHFINVDINAHATLDSLRIENFDTENPTQQTLVDLALSLDGVELSQQGKNFIIPAGVKLALQAKLSQLVEDPVVLANVSLRHVAVQAADISTELLAFDELSLSAIDYNAEVLNLAELQLKGLQGISTDGGSKPLLEFEDLLVKGISLPELKSLAIESTQLSGFNADAVLDKQRKLEKLQPVRDYLRQPAEKETVAKDSHGGEPGKSAEQMAKTEEMDQKFTVNLSRFSMDGGIYLKDKAIDPVFERSIEITDLTVENFNSADAAAYTDVLVKASVGEYSKIDLQGQLQALAENPSGFLKGSISGVELVPLSPYAADATGYFIRTGRAEADIDISLTKAELGGEVEVVLEAIKLAPGDEEKMAQLKTSISMPLDVALGLLRDKNGDIDLTLPMEGNINSPDFSLGSVMGQVSTKVLKKATIVGLKYALQPYGAMISLGSWLGEKATAVRLDPLLYAPGETAVTEAQKQYLVKIADIMVNTEGLRIKLCAQASPVEGTALHQVALVTNPQATPLDEEQLLEISRQRVEVVRQYLVEESKIDAKRLLLCQPRFDEEAKGKQSLVHLEIG